MLPVASTASDIAYYGLAIFLVAVGLALAYMFFRLGGTFQRLSSLVRGTERDLLPVIVKSGATVDRINYQLDKADTVTDSAVSMADSADTAVRAVSMSITKPVEKVSSAAAGLSHGIAKFRTTRDLGAARASARAAAKRRKEDLAHDLHVAGRTSLRTERPAATPPPAPQPKPVAVPRPEPVPRPTPVPEPPDEPPAAA
jgi:hypothetical protein